MAHPESYKAFAFKEKNGKLEEITVPWKDPQPGEVIIKVLACGVCGSDEGVQHQVFPWGLPRVPGHEIVGEIVTLGPGVTSYHIGQRVGAGWHGGQCGQCRSCRSGDFMTCENQTINGVNVDGGYAEYATLKVESLASVPEDMDPAEVAPLFCAGVTCFNSLRHMNVSAGDIVAVQGIGGLGHLALQFSKAMGFRTVALSSSPAKREVAFQLGASEYIDGSRVNQVEALQELGGAKVIVCTAPNPEAIQNLLGGLQVGGQLLVLALPEEPAKIPLIPLNVRRLSIVGWPSGAAKDSEETVLFAKQAGIHSVVQRYPLANAQEAFENLPKARFRAVLIP